MSPIETAAALRTTSRRGPLSDRNPAQPATGRAILTTRRRVINCFGKFSLLTCPHARRVATPEKQAQTTDSQPLRSVTRTISIALSRLAGENLQCEDRRLGAVRHLHFAKQAFH